MKNDIHPLLDNRLRQWRRWMRRPELCLGYPQKSAVFISGYVSGEEGFQHWAESVDAEANIIMNRLIDDLEPDESAAIHHVYLQAVFRLRDLEESYKRATDKLWRGMIAEGLA